jgi:FkbM family methyltransferase
LGKGRRSGSSGAILGFVWKVIIGAFHLARVTFFQGVDKKYLPAFFLEHVDDLFLSPFGRFLKDGGEPIGIRGTQKVSVPPGGVVIVLGGYLGESARGYLGRFPAARLIVFEPIPEFYSALRNDPYLIGAEISPSAAWVDSKGLELSLEKDATGMFASGPSKFVNTVDFAKFLDSLNSQPALLEINIEGAEFELMKHFLTNSTNLPRTILVQFHKVSPNSTHQREEVQELLRSRYLQTYSYDWVWERWDLSE